ncbi:MAG: hypothetical protein ACKO34_07075 [Vampirovibrionales bacterium]
MMKLEPFVLIVTGSPQAGKTQFVEALHTLTRGWKESVLWVQFETPESPSKGEHQYRPQQLSKRNYAHLVERLNAETHRPAGSWVDVLFAHLPEPLQTALACDTESPCHDVVLFPSHLPHTHNATAWHYGWRRLIEKHYALVIIDNLPHDKHWVLHPLRSELVTSVWLTHSQASASSLQAQWQHWQACGLPVQGGVLLNDVQNEAQPEIKREATTETSSQEATPTTTVALLQGLIDQNEGLHWLGRLPLLHPHPPRDEASQHQAEQRYLDSVQLALQRLPWEGAVWFHPTSLADSNG